MSDSLEAERAALRARLGAGARYDSPVAPAEDLVLARRGTAYFARKLNELADRELDAPSLVPGWTRRHLVAHVGYHARALTRLAEWGRTGIETPMHASAEERDAEIDLGATLPAQALRHLFTHSAVHLNVVWRDLEDAQWEAVVRTLEDSAIRLRELPMLRAREIWRCALVLGNGGMERDLPPQLRACRAAESN